MAHIYAVLAGVFIRSRETTDLDFDRSFEVLSKTVAGAPWGGVVSHDRWSDGAWQIVTEEPALSLRLSMVVMAALTASQSALPARIAVAMGNMDQPSSDGARMATGEAATRAHQALKTMKRGRVFTVSPYGSCMASQATAPLLDALCQQWTEAQAAPISLKLHPDAPAQIALAQDFGITAQSLNRRLQLACWREIETALRVVEAQPRHEDDEPQSLAS